MIINFAPVSMRASYTLAVAGDSIYINGKQHRLADLAGAVANEQPMPAFVATATEDSVTVILPYWGDAPNSVLFPTPVVNPADGPVRMPS